MPKSERKKEHKKQKGRNDAAGSQPVVHRIRTPVEGEVLGIAIQMLGGSRVRVQCMDGKVRLCRIRGKIVKRLWIREDDIVLVAPWEGLQDDRADIVHRYTKTQAIWLEKNGYLSLDREF
ncbi:MAG: translation initiation factor eIF-1A [Candidatus Helarchaeota archaeon]|nr:translation initiation factor eIF-1A [Candidatus Helarchaeota archaeon]